MDPQCTTSDSPAVRDRVPSAVDPAHPGTDVYDAAVPSGAAADVARTIAPAPDTAQITALAQALEEDQVRRRSRVCGEAVRLVALIDAAMNRILDAVLHHPEFQRIEALWRGVAWLVADNDDPAVRIRILDIRWTEIARDLERALDFDQSKLYDLIYSQEFGMPGGEPFGLVVIDHAVTHRLGRASKTDDVAVLEGLADVAAAAFCPIVVGADPSILALDQFSELDLRQDIAATMEDPSYARWKRMRQRPDSRFLGVVMPRLLMRTLHRGRDHPRLGFVYDEKARGSADMLWVNGAFALAHVTARAMIRNRWPAAIRGTLPRGEAGLIDGPVRQFLPSDRQGFVSRFAVENAVSEAQEVALNEAGMMAIRQLHLTDMAVFLNLPSLHRPPRYDSDGAQMNAKMGAMLQYILCVARFAHYIKVMARDWVGKYTDKDECSQLLQTWLDKFVNGSEDTTPEVRVRYPLREGRVTMFDMPGKPGSYGCEIAIRPHYQLDQISSEFRLTTMISSGRNG